jgi:threonine aldolase
MFFGSDNWAGVAPEILAALAAANSGFAPAYGDDALTQSVQEKIAALFETDCAVHFVATGGAANGLALSVLTPPYGMILCHDGSHVQTDECGGPEFLTGGAKLLTIPGRHGKLTPDAVRDALREFPDHPPHTPPPRVLSLTQSTECGTVYRPDEIRALGELAREHGLALHVDGARFANAVVATGATPAELTWKAGVDALSFGGTKNGCLAAEAVVFFDRARVADFEYRRKRAGHLWSKMRFLAAQFDAYLEGGLWLRLAAHANAMAARLAAGLAALDGVEICHPNETNEVFVTFPGDVADRLRAAGAAFYPWVMPGDPFAGRMNRLIASFRTSEEDVDRFLELAGRILAGGRA